MKRILGDDPDEVGEGMPESWDNTFSGEGFFWKDLYRKDVATRAEFVEEDQPAEDGEDAEVSKETMNVKLEEMRNQFEVFKEEMRNQFEVFKEEMRNQFEGFKEEMRNQVVGFKEKVVKTYKGKLKDFKTETKTLVARLVDTEFRKRTAATGSSYYEGECSTQEVVDDENAEDEDAENATEDEEADTLIGDYVRRLRKRRKQN